MPEVQEGDLISGVTKESASPLAPLTSTSHRDMGPEARPCTQCRNIKQIFPPTKTALTEDIIECNEAQACQKKSFPYECFKFSRKLIQ